MLSLKGKFRYFLTACLLSILFSGCLGTRYLEPGEKLLYKQKAITPKGFKQEGLNNLYVQKTNRRFLGMPINSLVWMYYTGERRYNPEKFKAKKEKIETKFNRKIANTKSESKKSSFQYRKQNKIDVLNGKIENGNMFMQWGEKAAVYDSSHVALSAEKLTDYLFTRGYFEATTAIEKSEKGKQGRKVSIKYHITPNAAYFYDSISHSIEDKKIKSLYEEYISESLIKKGDQFNQNTLNQERERIDNLLKDNGFYAFGRDYVEYDIDTTFGGYHKIALRLNILNPARLSAHKQFRIDSILFITDANTPTASSERGKRQIVPYRDISYQYYRNEYSKRILSQRIFLHKDSLYSRSSTINTQRQLANLGMFKFVNINYDTSGGKFIANLYSSALNRYSWSNEAGLTVTQGFPGPYYNMSFLKRNLFGGMEIFELNGRAGFEGVASATDNDFYKSIEAGLNATITFPQFLFPMSKEAQSRTGKLNPKTKILGGFTYSQRPEYERETTTFSYTYSWEKKRTTQYSFTLANLNIIRSSLDDAFRDLLDDLSETQGNNIRLSFNPSFVSSMIFSMTWNPENYGNTTSNSKYLRVQAESGGTFSKLYTPGIVEKDSLQLFKYLRLNVDYRKNRIINSNAVLAYRINTGVGWSYSDERVLPYEKYFFAGGSNSVRAWRPRRLGVGSAPPLLSADAQQDGLFDYSFEKPGEILLEGSVELRKKLFGFVNGAIFVDWGNVWSFNENQLESGSSEPNQAEWVGSTKFRLDNFYNEIAIGTGFGLRFDFSFLVLRFDVGVKVHDPAREEGDRFVLDDLKFFRPFSTGKEPVIYNIGIGYPF